MARMLTVVCAVTAVALTGCAATGTGDTSGTSSSAAVSSTIASSSIAAAASSPSATPSARTMQQELPATSASAQTQPTDQSAAVPTGADGSEVDGSEGWHDTWGWVSPQTAQRALAAGIAAGMDVRDELRCGIACGESPTAAEIQAQYVMDHPDNPNATVEAYEAAAAQCPGYFIRGNCYADAGAARDAGEGE